MGSPPKPSANQSSPIYHSVHGAAPHPMKPNPVGSWPCAAAIVSKNYLSVSPVSMTPFLDANETLTAVSLTVSVSCANLSASTDIVSLGPEDITV